VFWCRFLLPFFLVPALVFAQVVSITHTLTWVDNSDNEDGFRIESRVGRTGAFTDIGSVGAGVVTFEDVVSDGAERCYRVRAFNAAGFSGYTNEACGLSKPLDPDGLQIKVIIIINP